MHLLCINSPTFTPKLSIQQNNTVLVVPQNEMICHKPECIIYAPFRLQDLNPDLAAHDSS